MKLRNWRTFLVLVVVAVVIDAATKAWALAALHPGVTVRALGGLVPLTLSFNRGIAFGLHVGPASRAIFTVLSVVVLGVAVALFAATPPERRAQRIGLSLMCAGAVGNLADRLLRDRGVVDFIGPSNLGFMVWPIFNMADCYVVTGTLLFAIAVWWRRRREIDPANPSRPRTGPYTS